MKKHFKFIILLYTCVFLFGCATPDTPASEPIPSDTEEELQATDSDEADLSSGQDATEDNETASALEPETSTADETHPASESETEPAQAFQTEPIASSKIPAELQKLLADSFLAGTAAETLNGLMCDVVIDKENYDLYRNCGIDEDLDYLTYFGGILLKTDADNDGIEDLFLWVRDGGSSGNTTFYLAKGDVNGTYTITHLRGTLSQEIAFISYEERTYLVLTTFEYNKKAVNGFTIIYYEAGVISDTVHLETIATSWEANIITCMPEYQTLAEQYAELGKDGFHDASMYDYRISAGSGERVETGDETLYYADINNDVTEEWYTKHIFYPSSMASDVSMSSRLYFAGNADTYENLTRYYDLQYEGTPLTFWVEQITDGTSQTKQIICLLTYEGLDTNHIYGYLIEGDAVTEVFETEYNGQLEFVYE